MTFNQWCASSHVDEQCRAAFEAVYHELIDRGCPEHQAARLLSDVVESLPEHEFADDGEDW